MTVLVMGGTQAGVAIATTLAKSMPVIYSLAGVTRSPSLPDGARLHSGGFGGARPMAAWIQDTDICAVVLAVHPFATQIAAHTTMACEIAKLPLFVLEAGHWQQTLGDDWHWCNSLDAVGATISSFAPRAVFLALGKAATATLPPFRHVGRCIVRIAEPLAATEQACKIFPGASACDELKVIAAKGPFSEAAETQLFQEEAIDLLVCKDSGLASGLARLKAARHLKVPVVLLARPKPLETWRQSPSIHCHTEPTTLSNAVLNRWTGTGS